MDLGRPLARHHIRRPHEVIDLESEIDLDADATPDPEPAVEPPRLSSETNER